MKHHLLTLLAALSVGFAFTSCSATTTSGTKPYPLKTCIVSDNELGSMGTPITKVHQGQEVKFCCKPCIKKFDAAPAKYLAKLN